MPGKVIDKRKCPRRRTRLRSGKLATLKNRFLSDCQIFDRSEKGARVRLAGRMDLPEHVRLFDDELQVLFTARVAWRRGNEAGLCFVDPEEAVRRSRENEKLIRCFRERFYAIGRKA